MEFESGGALRSAVRQGLQASRANLLPGILLWLLALGIILGYSFVEPVHNALAQVAAWKLRYGFFFSIVSTSFFGGVLPYLFMRLLGRGRPGTGEFLFLVFFWAYKGVEVDLLYRIQALVFGDSSHWSVVLPKVLVDQFVYAPLWAVPEVILLFLWKDSGYDWRRALRDLGPRWYPVRVLPLLVFNFAIWIPAVTIIYCLPLALQLPVQNLVLLFYSLVVMVLVGKPRG